MPLRCRRRTRWLRRARRLRLPRARCPGLPAPVRSDLADSRSVAGAEQQALGETVDYMVAPLPTLSDEAKADEQAAEAPEKHIIFCVDVSGSMCVSQQIDASTATPISG